VRTRKCVRCVSKKKKKKQRNKTKNSTLVVLFFDIRFPISTTYNLDFMSPECISKVTNCCLDFLRVSDSVCKTHCRKQTNETFPPRYTLCYRRKNVISITFHRQVAVCKLILPLYFYKHWGSMFYLSFPFTRFRLRLNRLIPCFSITPTQANLFPTRRPSVTAQCDDAFLSRSFFFLCIGVSNFRGLNR